LWGQRLGEVGQPGRVGLLIAVGLPLGEGSGQLPPGGVDAQLQGARPAPQSMAVAALLLVGTASAAAAALPSSPIGSS
jgi:hypothetical protein